MTEFFVEHWGNLASVIGVLVSGGGLAWAICEAKGARSSAEAAEEAAKEATDATRNAIGRHLLIIDLERAINIIERLKLLHRNESWEAALENYQTLRAMLSAIIARYPENESEPNERLSKARAGITEMEEYVEERVRQDLEIESDELAFNQQLNSIQSDLEDMSNTIELGG